MASYTATHFLPNTSSSPSPAGVRAQQRSSPPPIKPTVPAATGPSGSGGPGLPLFPAACKRTCEETISTKMFGSNL